MSTPPAGWYPDPVMASTQRYWDGAQWTAHVAPLAPSASSAPPAPAPSAPTPDHGPATVEHWLVPVGRSWQSITAGYLGFLCLVTWAIPIAGIAIAGLTLWLGLWAMRLAGSNGGHGRGRAIFGIVCATLSLIAAIFTTVT